MGKTIDQIKQTRTVSEEVKSKVKNYNAIKKKILAALEERPKTVPELVKELNEDAQTVTFYLMTLRKFGNVETDEVDDNDEYFFYKLKK
jgi:predicted transcriptional regulator